MSGLRVQALGLKTLEFRVLGVRMQDLGFTVPLK